MSFLSVNIGIDPGTCAVKIYSKGSGIVLNEPSLVAVDKQDGKIISAGQEADEMIGKIPDSVNAFRPIKKGEITDFNIAKGMFRIFLDRCNSGRILKPRVLVAISSNCTDVQKRAVEEAILAAGAKTVVFKDKTIAAAVGAGIDIKDMSGSLIVDIGAGTADVAAISMGAVVSSKSIAVGGDDFSDSIIRHVKNKYGVIIGNSMAEEVKNVLIKNTADDNQEYVVIGRDVSSGLPGSANVVLTEMKEALSVNMSLIIDGIKSVLESTPPELVSDIIKKGAVLTGGSSCIYWLRDMIYKELDLSTVIADNPECSVILGLGSIISKEINF